MSRFASAPLAKHDGSTFDSGNERIDVYFRTIVSQDVRRKYLMCYVLIESQTNSIAGFYTLSSRSIPLVDVPPEVAKKLPRYPSVPAVMIGWLGRDTRFRAQQIGPMLLQDAITRVLTSPVGAFALIADAIDERAEAFYRKHLFMPLVDEPGRLCLPLATVQR